jgi:hypothetical protein
VARLKQDASGSRAQRGSNLVFFGVAPEAQHLELLVVGVAQRDDVVEFAVVLSLTNLVHLVGGRDEPFALEQEGLQDLDGGSRHGLAAPGYAQTIVGVHLVHPGPNGRCIPWPSVNDDRVHPGLGLCV